MTNKEERAEKLSMVKYFYKEWEYRHKEFWGLLYKSFSAIGTVLTLPYFLALSNNLLEMLWIFPILGIILCVSSFILLNFEGVRITALRKRINDILYSVSAEYKERPLEKGLFRKLYYIRVVNLVLVAYIGLMILFVLQLIFILNGNFVEFVGSAEIIYTTIK